MKIAEIISEMAAPSVSILAKTYYHGTSNSDAAYKILKNGIQPPDLSLRHGLLKPVTGKVYITSNLGYAQIYAIGGDIAGTYSKPPNYGMADYGYIFVIPGAELKDVQPDEDSIGQFLSDILDTDSSIVQDKAYNDKKLINNVYQLAKRYLAQSTLDKVESGEYAYFAKAGKVLVKRLSDEDKLKMIEYGFHIAHTGAIIPAQCWRIDLEKISQLKNDGSNFFELAERVK